METVTTRLLPSRAARTGRAAALALARTALVLGVLEALLRLGGYVPRWRPQLEEFTATRLFVPGVDDLGRAVWRTAPEYRESFLPVAFAAEKGRAVRLFALGGSAVYGWRLPDPPHDNFVAALEAGLAARHPDQAFEAVDVGGLSWGTARESRLVDELLGHQPDVLVLMTGHNEFWEYPIWADLTAPRWTALRALRVAEHSRLGLALIDLGTAARRALAARRRPRPEAYRPVDDALELTIRARFEANLRTMVRRARAAGVAVVLATVPANLEVEPEAPNDWLADASRHDPELAPARLAAWNAAWAAGRAAAAAGDWDGALRAYRAAAAVDPGFAREWREIGRCLEHLGRWREAREALWRHLDRSRRLITRPLNDTIRRVGREEGVVVVDVASRFEAAAPHGLPGYGLFLDSMHPNRAGHALIARAFLDLDVNHRLIRPSRTP